MSVGFSIFVGETPDAKMVETPTVTFSLHSSPPAAWKIFGQDSLATRLVQVSRAELRLELGASRGIAVDNTRVN